MPTNGCKCADGSTMPANGKCETCPAGQNMGTNGKCECPSGQVMANGACTTPCVSGTDAVCSQSTPSCVASDGSERCGGAAVLGETLGRTTDVLGVSIEAPAVAAAGLARTGGFQLTALIQAGIILAMVGLGLTVMGRRRRQTVNIAERLGDRASSAGSPAGEHDEASGAPAGPPMRVRESARPPRSCYCHYQVS
jgi:hypothetical protein